MSLLKCLLSVTQIQTYIEIPLCILAIICCKWEQTAISGLGILWVVEELWLIFLGWRLLKLQALNYLDIIHLYIFSKLCHMLKAKSSSRTGLKAAAELLSTLCTSTCACMCSPQINGRHLIWFNPLKFFVQLNLCFRLLLYSERDWHFEQLLSLVLQKSVLRMGRNDPLHWLWRGFRQDPFF